MYQKIRRITKSKFRWAFAIYSLIKKVALVDERLIL